MPQPGKTREGCVAHEKPFKSLARKKFLVIFISFCENLFDDYTTETTR